MSNQQHNDDDDDALCLFLNEYRGPGISWAFERLEEQKERSKKNPQKPKEEKPSKLSRDYNSWLLLAYTLFLNLRRMPALEAVLKQSVPLLFNMPTHSQSQQPLANDPSLENTYIFIFVDARKERRRREDPYEFLHELETVLRDHVGEDLALLVARPCIDFAKQTAARIFAQKKAWNNIQGYLRDGSLRERLTYLEQLIKKKVLSHENERELRLMRGAASNIGKATRDFEFECAKANRYTWILQSEVFQDLQDKKQLDPLANPYHLLEKLGPLLFKFPEHRFYKAMAEAIASWFVSRGDRVDKLRKQMLAIENRILKMLKKPPEDDSSSVAILAPSKPPVLPIGEYSDPNETILFRAGRAGEVEMKYRTNAKFFISGRGDHAEMERSLYKSFQNAGLVLDPQNVIKQQRRK